MANLTSFLSSDCRNQSLNIFSLFCKVMEMLLLIFFFSFALRAHANTKNIFAVFSHSLLLKCTQLWRLRGSENPGNVKRVHKQK